MTTSVTEQIEVTNKSEFNPAKAQLLELRDIGDGGWFYAQITANVRISGYP